MNIDEYSRMESIKMSNEYNIGWFICEVHMHFLKIFEDFFFLETFGGTWKDLRKKVKVTSMITHGV